MTTEIAKMLVLSTAHLTPECCNEHLKNNDGPWYEKADYGWFVHVVTEGWEEFPSSLLDCLGHAENLGCEWVMFDRDAPTIPDLTIYDWETA